MSDAGVTYLTVEIARLLHYCSQEYDMNMAETVGTLRIITAGLELDCIDGFGEDVEEVGVEAE